MTLARLVVGMGAGILVLFLVAIAVVPWLGPKSNEDEDP